MNTHNDVECLIDEAIRRESDMDECAKLYLEAEDRELGWIGEAHERSVINHHEADGMLDAALDEVFEQTFSVYHAGDDSRLMADVWALACQGDHAERYNQVTSARIVELMTSDVRPVTRSWTDRPKDMAQKLELSKALGCPVDKLCRTRDGSWTMR